MSTTKAKDRATKSQASDAIGDGNGVAVLRQHAEDQGYVFAGPVSLDFRREEDLVTGRFRVRSQAAAQVVAAPERSPAGRSAGVVLEVNGSTHSLNPPGLVVGRGSEADLRINDPGVSRRHAQFLVTTRTGQGVRPGEGELEIEVHDMGSTNGITVDGRKVSRVALRDGSRVQVGHTSLVVRLLAEEDAGV